MKLFITEQAIKIKYTILYKLLYHLIFRSCLHNRTKPTYETVHHHIHAILQDGLRSSYGEKYFLFRFRMQIVDDEDATSDQFSMSVVGKSIGDHTCAHCFPQPVVSSTITNTSKQPYFKSVGQETDRECSYILHSWLATRRTDYL